MRRLKFNLSTSISGAWEGAVDRTAHYFTKNVKANQLLDSLPKDWPHRERSTCQALFLGALRNGHRIKAVLQPFLQQDPNALIEAILMVAGYEILSEPSEKAPQIIHHAVEKSKKLVRESETRLLNALLRKLPEALESAHLDNRPDIFLSHPRWLFRRWNKHFGLPTTLEFMRWNQQIPEVYLKFYEPSSQLSTGLEPTQWDGFYKVSPGASWHSDIVPLLNQGSVYAKDPSTRLAPELLAPKKGEQVLDLCASPGGKTYDLAYKMQLEGQIVALDLPGGRIKKLRENLALLARPSLNYSIVEANLLEIQARDFKAKQLPYRYDAVMLDAPCSNTGVIQRRTDVKWRLKPKDIKQCSHLQKKMIAAASSYVKPGGRLVYSTCSIDPDENRAVIDSFLASNKGQRFTLKESIVSMPWETGHDGAGAFLMVADPSK